MKKKKWTKMEGITWHPWGSSHESIVVIETRGTLEFVPEVEVR